MLSSQEVDHEVRWCVLKLADILFRPVEETPPTVRIHIPITPVAEVSPQLPSVKLSTKLQRGLKSASSGTAPLAPVTVPPRLKLPGSVPLPDPSPRTATPNPLPDPPVRIPVTPSISASRGIQPKVKGRPPKSIKPVQAPKGQSGGMSLNDLRACRNALKKLNANKHARLFLQPVDPIRDQAPK